MPLVKNLISNSDFWTESVPLGLLIIFLVVGGWHIQRNALAFAGGSDSSGYLHNARMLVEGELYGEVRLVGELPFDALHSHVYQPLGFQIEPKSQRQRPTYPFGLPLLFAFLDLILSEELSVLIGIALIAVATPLGVFLCGRAIGLTRWWSLAAALAIGMSPVYVFMALQPMTDAYSACLGVYCIYFALKLGREAERAHYFALLVGALFALLVITRLSNSLFALALCVTLIWKSATAKQWLLIGLGGLPGLVFLVSVNKSLYGSPFSTGYAGHFELFRLEYFWKTAWHFGNWLWITLGPLAICGFLVSLVWIRQQTGLILLLWTWAVPTTLLYSFYRYSSEAWWFLRFLLPVYPAIVIGGSLALQGIARSVSRCRKSYFLVTALVAAAVIFSFAWEWHWTKKLVRYLPKENEVYVKFANWAKVNAAPDALMICFQLSGNVYYYLPNPIVRYDLLKRDQWEVIIQEAERLDLEVYAPLFLFEWKENEALERKIPGVWVLEETFNDCHLYRLDTSATIEQMVKLD